MERRGENAQTKTPTAQELTEAVATAAATCIDAGLDDRDAVIGFRAALKNLRARLSAMRGH
jgi:hypothetical protein